MKNVLILGAGKSSTVLIEYMLRNAVQDDWQITVGDLDEYTAAKKINFHERGRAIYFNVDDDTVRRNAIASNDLIISLLPATLHSKVARDCVEFGKHFISASYVSPEMRSLNKDAVAKGLILLNEMGLDPGIDHMSAMEIIDELREQGAEIRLFESYTGGLIATSSDNNPWNYKFTWNPRNVILAGQGTAKFLWDDELKYIPYQKLFSRYDVLEIPGYGEFEGYPNRDSLQYREIYGLEKIRTLVRGTLRKRGFCDAWNVFVQLGMTEDTYEMENSHLLSWNDFTKMFLPSSTSSTKETLKQYCNADETVLNKIEWLGLFSDEKINLQRATPAQALQKLLESKLMLDPGDRDMCVMLHLIGYRLDGADKQIQASMVIEGDDELHTAMAKTVGLPLGIAAKMILRDEIKARGVLIPVSKEIYKPVLKELNEEYGIRFTHLKN